VLAWVAALLPRWMPVGVPASMPAWVHRAVGLLSSARGYRYPSCGRETVFVSRSGTTRLLVLQDYDENCKNLQNIP
jgi:hypothetical protein